MRSTAWILRKRSDLTVGPNSAPKVPAFGTRKLLDDFVRAWRGATVRCSDDRAHLVLSLEGPGNRASARVRLAPRVVRRRIPSFAGRWGRTAVAERVRGTDWAIVRREGVHVLLIRTRLLPGGTASGERGDPGIDAILGVAATAIVGARALRGVKIDANFGLRDVDGVRWLVIGGDLYPTDVVRAVLPACALWGVGEINGARVAVAGVDEVLAVVTCMGYSTSEFVQHLGRETGVEPPLPDDLLPAINRGREKES